MGGGTITDESFIPGFICDPCAIVTRVWSSPVYTDFKLAEKGLDFIFSEGGRGGIFDDGTCIMNYPAVLVADNWMKKHPEDEALGEDTVRKAVDRIDKIMKTEL